MSNSTTIDYGEASQLAIEFPANVEGNCYLHFANSHSETAELVTLNYNIEHSVLGIPQMLFLLVAIGVLLLFVVAGYIAMGKYG